MQPSHESGGGTFKDNAPIWSNQIRLENEDILLQCIRNDSPEAQAGVLSMVKNLVHFIFCLEGTAHFYFAPHYVRELAHGRNYLFFNPDEYLEVRVKLTGRGKLVMLTISLQHLHTLFTHEPLPFLRQENINRKYYDEKDISAGLLLVLHQLFTSQLYGHAEQLFFQAKVLEIISHYFSTKAPDVEACPFLQDEDKIQKIKTAKEYLLKQMDNPPSLKALSKHCGLNEYQLKVGFKEVYGNTVYGYLLDHKLDHSRILLDKGKYQVNEVAHLIGYTNPSHFIAAFKKKFGITPKKYLMSQMGRL